MAAPLSGASAWHASGLLQRPARLLGLHVQRAVPTATLPAGRYDQLFAARRQPGLSGCALVRVIRRLFGGPVKPLKPASPAKHHTAAGGHS
ncbi:MAG: hypothetical protein H0W90_09355 [Actinobacteria bacterium]|nr:hypothetical protein [Actinomycetota bacterium]